MPLETSSTERPQRADRDAARVGRHSEPYVLLVLARGRSYGYEIRAQLEAFGFRRAVQEPSVVYRILKRLEDGGLIVSEWDTSGPGPARHYYQLTDAGRAQLAAASDQLARQARRIEMFFEAYAALPRPAAVGA